MTPIAEFDALLLSRIEDAGLNASAPPQQRWVDGWLLRCWPGKAKRGRCINALAVGRSPIDDKLARCAAVFRDAGLPLLVRITPFTLPADLDAQLEARGFGRVDDTRVMVRGSLDALPATAASPQLRGWHVERAGAEDFADAIGALRGSTPAERAAHAQRLAGSPVPCQPFLLRGDAQDDGIAACALFAREAEWVGLYDVFTAPPQRGRGLASALCARLLASARAEGARSAYLQVESDNGAARTVYRRLGFVDAYAYHYRTAPTD